MEESAGGFNISEASTSTNTIRCHENASDKGNQEAQEGVPITTDNPCLAQEDDREEEICVLCDKFMNPSKSQVVQKRCIANLIQASLKRKDKKYKEFKNLQQLTIHTSCSRAYIRQSSIDAARKKARIKISRCRTLAKEGREFDFSRLCFICSFSYEGRHSIVRKQSTIDNFIAQAKKDKTAELNKLILYRLLPIKMKDDSYYESRKVRYHKDCANYFYLYKAYETDESNVRNNSSEVVCFIINYLAENADECQFGLNGILDEYTAIHGETDFPRLRTIQDQLKNHFGNEIMFYSGGPDLLICFKRTLGNILEEKWYSERKKKKQEEKLRIIETVAHIILQDIRTTRYYIYQYDLPTIGNAKDDVPQSLKLFLDVLITTHKYDRKNKCEKWDNKIVTAAHILMSNVRPRSFCSSILLGLTCLIRTKYDARGLIDCLHNIGICVSYFEIVKFQKSKVLDGIVKRLNDPDNLEILVNEFVQFVFYNNCDDDCHCTKRQRLM